MPIGSTRRGWKKKGLEAKRSPTTLDIAWAAGVFEGDGTAYSPKQNTISVGVTQKDPELLYKLKELFGGTVGPQGKYFQWLISGSRARGFVMTIYKFLTTRRKIQVKKALDNS